MFSTFAPTQFEGDRDLDLLYGGALALTRALVAFCADDERLMPVAPLPMSDPAAQRGGRGGGDRAGRAGAARAVQAALRPVADAPRLRRRVGPAGRGRTCRSCSTSAAAASRSTAAYHDNGNPVNDWLGGGENIRTKDLMVIHAGAEAFLSAMVLDGVFERFDGLRGGCIELGAMWVVPWLKRLDIAQSTFVRSEPSLALPLAASEYAHRQLWFTPFPTEPVGWMIEQAGDDMFLFSSDYPHPEGGRDPLKRFESSMAGVGRGEQGALLQRQLREDDGDRRPCQVTSTETLGRSPMASPLDGVKVLDLCRVLAGPHAGRILADLGADVVKVEPPEGDVSRLFGKKPESAYFRQQNAGKRSITVDLTTEEGRDLVTRLAAAADVVTENFRPGVMARFGLAYDDLVDDQPAARDAVDLRLRPGGAGARPGVVRRRDPRRDRRDRPPPDARRAPQHVDIEISMADTVTGLHGVIGVLSALRLRDATGLGQHVDMAMIDAMAMSDDYLPNEVAAAPPAASARPPARSSPRRSDDDAGAAHTRTSPSEIIAAPDGKVIVMGEFKWIWKSHQRAPRRRRPDAGGRRRSTRRSPAAARPGTTSTSRSPPAPSCSPRWTRPTWRGASSSRAPRRWTRRRCAHRGSIVEIEDPDGNYTIIRTPYRFSNGDVRRPRPGPPPGRAPRRDPRPTG